eukprot:scaffold1321_cov402-Prasinococcus_capsulatus_cf.AAC.11
MEHAWAAGSVGGGRSLRGRNGEAPQHCHAYLTDANVPGRATGSSSVNAVGQSQRREVSTCSAGNTLSERAGSVRQPSQATRSCLCPHRMQPRTPPSTCPGRASWGCRRPRHSSGRTAGRARGARQTSRPPSWARRGPVEGQAAARRAPPPRGTLRTGARPASARAPALLALGGDAVPVAVDHQTTYYCSAAAQT